MSYVNKDLIWLNDFFWNERKQLSQASFRRARCTGATSRCATNLTAPATGGYPRPRPRSSLSTPPSAPSSACQSSLSVEPCHESAAPVGTHAHHFSRFYPMSNLFALICTGTQLFRDFEDFHLYVTCGWMCIHDGKKICVKKNYL